MADYCSSAEVKTRLKISGTDDDARITALITAVTAYIDGEIGGNHHAAAITDDVRYYDGRGRLHLVLRGGPWDADPSSVHVSTDIPRVYDAGTLLDTSTAYILDAELGSLHRVDGQRWASGPKTIKIVITHGESAPADLKQAAIEIIQVKLVKGKEKQYHVTGERQGEGQINIRAADVPAHAQRVIDRYVERI